MRINQTMATIQETSAGNQAPLATAFRARRSRRDAIEAFFLEHLGQRFDSMELHQRFGTSFRARKSEIDRDPQSRIRIFNETTAGQDEHGEPCERSVYWAELRGAATQPPKRPESDYMRRRREELEQIAPLFAGAQ
jgi:hypothetical protein